jgi:glycosyltransferase involved in cell wall biosynthesis
MRILCALTYYRPHVSGLTIYAERLARAFQRRNHQVTILTSQYCHDLPCEEVQEGVKIVRVPVAFRLSKGVIMPSWGRVARRLVCEHDVIQLHLPQFDAARVALQAHLMHKPTVVTYHCDLRLPPGIMNRLADRVVSLTNYLTAIWSHRIVTYTQDYAEQSAYTRRFLNKVAVIDPPVELPEVSLTEVTQFRARHRPPGSSPIIGMAARFATEKGVEVLLSALPKILEIFPKTQVQFAGPFQNIIGEETYFQRLWPIIEQYQNRQCWHFLGVLDPRQMALFYRSIDLLVLPSLNSTEAFGLVQIEAMLNGVPCITSNLPGVRQPVLRHGMGKIVPIGNSQALAEAVVEVLSQCEKFRFDPHLLRVQYAPDTIACQYEELFEKIAQGIKQA